MTEIEQIIQLYKEKKLTRFALECELGRLISNEIVDIPVEITKGSARYIATILPQEYNGGIKTSLLISDTAIVDYLTTSELVDVIVSVAESRVPVMSLFTKFLRNKDRAEISRSEWYILYLKLYLLSLNAIHPNVLAKFDERKIDYTKNETVAELINKLEDANTKEEVDALVEVIKTKDIIPAKTYEVIEDCFEKYRSAVTITIVDREATTEEVPTMNAFAAAIAAATNSKVGLNIQDHLPEFLSGKYERQ